MRFSDFISQTWEKIQTEVYIVLCSDFVFLNVGSKEGRNAYVLNFLNYFFTV